MVENALLKSQWHFYCCLATVSKENNLSLAKIARNPSLCTVVSKKSKKNAKCVLTLNSGFEKDDS